MSNRKTESLGREKMDKELIQGNNMYQGIGTKGLLMPRTGYLTQERTEKILGFFLWLALRLCTSRK